MNKQIVSFNKMCQQYYHSITTLPFYNYLPRFYNYLLDTLTHYGSCRTVEPFDPPMQITIYIYRIMGIVRGRKSLQISQIWKHSQTFLCIFLSRPGFYIYEIAWIAKVFSQTMAKKVRNLRNFSSADDSHYTVYSTALR